MRKILFALLSALTVSFTAFADDYEPTSTWPYMYQDFTAGKLEQPGGGTKDALFNVCLTNASLHFIEGDMVREMNPADVFAVRIGNDYYMNVAGKLLKLLSRSENGMVVEQFSIDYARLNSSQGAYGSSGTTIATQNLSSLEGIGASPVNMNMTHMALKNSKDEGKILPLIHKMAVFVDKKLVDANARDISDAFGVDKESLKQFQKDNKIKWKDPLSIQKVIDFIAR